MAKAREPVSIDGIAFDALIDSDELWQSDVPNYPTEAGFEISDTIIIRPLVLNMTLYLTNTPVTWRNRNSPSPFRVQETLQRLNALYFSKTPVTVKTTEQDYVNMAIVSIGLPKKLETGTSRKIPISLQQIMTTEIRTASIPASLGRGGATGVNAGVANVASANPPTATANARNNVTASASNNNNNAGTTNNRGSIPYNAAGNSGLLSGLLGR